MFLRNGCRGQFFPITLGLKSIGHVENNKSKRGTKEGLGLTWNWRKMQKSLLLYRLTFHKFFFSFFILLQLLKTSIYKMIYVFELYIITLNLFYTNSCFI